MWGCGIRAWTNFFCHEKTTTNKKPTGGGADGGAARRVHWVGHVDDDDLLRVAHRIADADVLVTLHRQRRDVGRIDADIRELETTALAAIAVHTRVRKEPQRRRQGQRREFSLPVPALALWRQPYWHVEPRFFKKYNTSVLHVQST